MLQLKNLLKGIFSLILIAIFLSSLFSGCSDSPIGKSWMTKSKWGATSSWTEFSLGTSECRDDSSFIFATNFFDAYGTPLRTTEERGHFNVNGNTVTLIFENGQSYNLQYEEVDGETCLVDGSGEVYIWDDPSKRDL